METSVLLLQKMFAFNWWLTKGHVRYLYMVDLCVMAEVWFWNREYTHLQ